MFESIPAVLGQLFTLKIILLVATATLLSVVVGILPGVGSATAIVLMFPFLFGMQQMDGIFFLSGLIATASIGGAVTAILLNIPGETANIATTFDGHQMARRGEAGRALGIAICATFFGLLFGFVVIALLLPLVMKIVFAFQPPEFFALIMLALVTVSVAARANMLKGLASAGIGILLSLAGYSKFTGDMRFTFGSQNYMWDGFTLIVFFTGLFAVREVIAYGPMGADSAIAASAPTKVAFRGVLEGARDVLRHWRVAVQSSVFGTFIGMLPGIGGTVANLGAYTLAMQTSKRPELFGTGIAEGVVASESGGNAKDGGALLPTLAFGIPGSLEMALALGAFTLLGMAPGPGFIAEHPQVLWALIFGNALSALIAGALILLSAKFLVHLTLIKVKYLFPIVLVLAMVGVYAVRENILDVGVALLVGVFGYLFERFGYSVICLTIGFVLGDIAESAFIQSLQMSLGDYTVFFTRPISAGLLALAVILLFVPFLRKPKNARG